MMQQHNDSILIGYDVRFGEIAKEFQWITEKYKSIQRVYSRYDHVWRSRFVQGGVLEQELRNTNFREPHPTVPRVIPMHLEYSEQYYLTWLWGNLGSMLCRYQVMPSIDTVVAFTLQDVSAYPDLICKEDMLQDIMQDSVLVHRAIEDEDNPLKIYTEQWRFAGYDIGDDTGYSPLFYDTDMIDELASIEKYNAWGTRNKEGLFDSLDDAVTECRLVNAYDHFDCPYFIWGVYLAVNPERLTLPVGLM